ncbi:MAG: RnfABCDGE type electron transport complex subunit D [Devosiaceae bacterium]|nr:RnfABCDGE type electron transport complex subunit D [Devosiaceae bacterium]
MKLPFKKHYFINPPYLRSVWSAKRIALVTLLCLLPPLGVALLDKGIALFTVVMLSIIVVLSWQIIFSFLRKRKLGWEGFIIAIVFALFVGETVSYWQIILALSFGIIIGEQIFGGRGFGFLNPAIVALMFLTFSFSGTSFAEPSPWFAIATLPSAILLVTARLISWRIIVGILVGLIGVGLLRGQIIQVEMVSASFIFIIVFLACDPVGSASTNLGRWINGLLIGGLAWVFTQAATMPTGADALIPAILLASIFSPLIDTLVVLQNTYARRRPDA